MIPEMEINIVFEELEINNATKYKVEVARVVKLNFLLSKVPLLCIFIFSEFRCQTDYCYCPRLLLRYTTQKP